MPGSQMPGNQRKGRFNRMLRRMGIALGLALHPARDAGSKAAHSPAEGAELDEEIQFHLAMSAQTIQSQSELSDQEARRQARIAFGAVEAFREQSYRQRQGPHSRWLLETFLSDARYTLRGLRRNPVFTFAVLATLALGIGATTAVFSVVDRILFRALPYAHDDRLVSVGLTAPIIPEEFLLGGSYYVWQDNQKPFEALTSETGIAPCDLTEHNPARLDCASVEANFLPTLGLAPLLGRNFLPEEDRPNGPKVALISYGLWRSRYASDARILNRLIDIDGAKTRIIGVLPKDFEMPTLEATDIVLPQALDQAEQRRADPGRVMVAFARLKPGISAAVAQAELEPLFQYSLKLVPPGFRSEVHLRVRSMRDRQMREVRLSAWVLLGSVLAVMLIACGNVSSLILARGKVRERELAVRSALGASWARLISHTLTEGLVLALAGSGLGWLLAEALLQLFLGIAPAGLPFLNHASLDLRIAAFTAGLAVVCGLLFGALSALERPRSIINATRSGSGRSGLLRRTLVVAQIAVSMILLCASSLFVRSFWNLQRQNLGIHSHSLITATITLSREHYGAAQQQMQFFKDAQTALRRLPGVSAVAVSDSLPPAGAHRESIFERMSVFGRAQAASGVDGAGGTGGMVAWRWVTPEYFRALGIPIERGRGFSPDAEASSQPQMILSKSLADRLFPGEDPIGRLVRPSVADPFFTIVGVVANVKNSGLTGQDEPEYYRLRRNVADDWNSSSVLIVENSASSLPSSSLAPWVRAEIARIDPTIPIEIQSMQERVNELAAGPRFETSLLGFFALIGLAMAVIGLYGVTAYLAEQRTQEIGVRMALGADRADILRLIAGEGVRLLIAGTALGVSASLALTQFLKSLLFDIGPRDPVTFIGVVLLLGSIAILAALIPARRAARVDPVVALRYE